VVGSHAVAEEVAQDTWLAVIRGIEGFEHRSSLKTWIFGILMNQARTRRSRESRTVPVSFMDDDATDGPSVPADRFVADGERWAGHWSAPPVPWSDTPAERLIGAETVAAATAAINELPGLQRTVVTLRDVESWTSQEVSELLGITANNQRVALHRGRSRVRTRLELHLAGDV
jgi:RNA polymerase sigma-70 factor (ECF subfamily)